VAVEECSADGHDAQRARGPSPIVRLGRRIRAQDVPTILAANTIERTNNRDRTLVCDASQIIDPDCETIDALARLSLEARRAGLNLRLRDPSPALRRLIGFCGLGDALLADAAGPATTGTRRARRPRG